MTSSNALFSITIQTTWRTVCGLSADPQACAGRPEGGGFCAALVLTAPVPHPVAHSSATTARRSTRRRAMAARLRGGRWGAGECGEEVGDLPAGAGVVHAHDARPLRDGVGAGRDRRLGALVDVEAEGAPQEDLVRDRHE